METSVAVDTSVGVGAGVAAAVAAPVALASGATAGDGVALEPQAAATNERTNGTTAARQETLIGIPL